MHLYELLACFALNSGALVCVIVHPFLWSSVEFVFGFRVRAVVLYSRPFSG